MRGTKPLATKIPRWLDKWLFFVFKGTEEALTKVTRLTDTGAFQR